MGKEIMKTLRDYQIDIAQDGFEKLKTLGIVYLALEVRLGKSCTSLEICRLSKAKKVLFLTKKKAISSIEEDYRDFGFDKHFELTVTNNESLHKVTDNDFDIVVMDEAHRFGSFPKASKMAKDFKARFCNIPLILLSGTPSPETESQLFHQFWISKNTPFKEKTFYQWAKNYVNVYQVNFGYGMVNSYERANADKIKAVVDKYFITFTQSESGFTSKVNENFLTVKMKDTTYSLIDRLVQDKVIETKKGDIIADSAVKLQSKIHQISSGTIKFECGNTFVFDHSKADFIFEHFRNNKIAIFYKFVAELDALKEVFGIYLTTDLDEFNNSGKNIALQIVSGREGISLRNAEYLVYYNIDFSAVSYWQSRDRMTTMERLENNIYWVFSDKGIEQKIYKAVQAKKNYTLRYFKKDYKI